MTSSNQKFEEELCASARYGNADDVIKLLDQNTDIDAARTAPGYWVPLTALMMASYWGHVECVKVLLDRGALVNKQDKNGQTPLMKASFNKHVECLKELLDRGAHVNMNDKRGWSALMWASSRGRVECVKELLERGAQVNMQSEEGDTALHIAARNCEHFWIKENDKAICVKTLLSHPGIDIDIKNNEGLIAMMDATLASLGVFKRVLRTCNDFPANSYGKVMLCGHSGAGKSTLTRAIRKISKPKATRLLKRVFERQSAVEPLTAGIIPYQVDSPYGNMVIFDLAGHHHYFSSHSACLEATFHNDPAIFLLLQDLRKDPEAMTKEVYYWSTMIDGVCHKCPQQSSVIVVGTHADLLKKEQLTTKLTHLKSVAALATCHQKLVSVMSLNLTSTYGAEMDKFKTVLDQTKSSITSLVDRICLHSHLMLAFMKEKLGAFTEVLTVSDLLEQIITDFDNLIEPDMVTIIAILNVLSDKGLIVLFLSDDPLKSWIVLHKESILMKIYRTLFADPPSTPIASNTGIIPCAVLNKFFSQYDAKMLARFMIHFGLCQAVDLLHLDTLEGSDLGPLIFFPALVSVDRPSSATVPKNGFEWSMIVKCPEKFFSTSLLHFLLSHLPFKFALPAAQTTPLHSVCNRNCTVWSRGVRWISKTGVVAKVEMSDMFQSLSMSIFSPDRKDLKYFELARTLLDVIKNACQKFCPRLEVVDVISCPPEASLDCSDDTMVDLLSLLDALYNSTPIVSDWRGQKHVSMEEWIRIEPCLSELVGVSQCNQNPSECVMKLPQLEVSQSCQKLSECMMKLPQLEGTPTMPDLMSFSAGKLTIADHIGANYLRFGILLLNDQNGVIVEAIEREHHWNAEQINMAILQRWIQGRGIMPVTWLTLATVLETIQL